MVQEKYTVRLSVEDRDQLRGLIHSGRHSARVILSFCNLHAGMITFQHR